MQLRWISLLSPILFLMSACAESGDSPAGTGAEAGAVDRNDDPQPAAVDPMASYGISASNVFFYYEDLAAATRFYRQELGLRQVADYGFAKILRVAPASFLTLVDADEGMHDADDPKTTAIALVTDQLDEWWDYLGSRGVEMRSDSYEPEPGSAHDGFVAIDPEGYLLEFERFNEHPENDALLPVLSEAETLYPESGASNVPPGLGFKSTIVWFYYRDMPAIQRFYEDVLGFELIADQGWTKIYPVGPTGYIGLVDESRGMHRFTEEKGVTMSFITDDVSGWFAYLQQLGDVEMRHEDIETEDNYEAFVAYDPGGYFLEWDRFTDVPANRALLQALQSR